MKKTLDNISIAKSDKEETGIRFFLKKQKNKLKNGQFTCPLCREVFTGISAMGSHLKEHCT